MGPDDAYERYYGVRSDRPLTCREHQRYPFVAGLQREGLLSALKDVDHVAAGVYVGHSHGFTSKERTRPMKPLPILAAALLLVACAHRPVDHLPAPSGWTENQIRMELPDGLYQSSRSFHDHRASLLVLAIAPMEEGFEGVDRDALVEFYEASRPERVGMIVGALEKEERASDIATETYPLDLADGGECLAPSWRVSWRFPFGGMVRRCEILSLASMGGGRLTEKWTWLSCRVEECPKYDIERIARQAFGAW